MTQHGTQPGNTAVDPQTQTLLDQIGGRQSALPRRTLIAMAMGGLRVRLMRSVVTLISVILAIGFLFYMGMASKLVSNLAHATQPPQFPVEKQPALAAAANALATKDLASQLTQSQKYQLVEGLDVPNPAWALAWSALLASLTESQIVELHAAAGPASSVDPGTITNAIRHQHAVDLRNRLQNDPGTWPQILDQISTDIKTDLVHASAARPTDHEIHLRLAELFTQDVGRIPSLPDAKLRALQLLLGWTRPDDHTRLMLEALKSEQLAREGIAIDRLLRTNLISASEQLESGNPMDRWLILMALLTCAVGITNAMLMSVTERFREIGTMKCLGAQDRLVVQLFLIESGLLGVVGSAAGIVLGIAVALAAAALQFGGYGMQYFPWLGGLTVTGWSIVAGVLISVFGAVYPARVAARMNPVDALRIDE